MQAGRGKKDLDFVGHNNATADPTKKDRSLLAIS
jgi:hypothetical protein